MIRPMIVIMVLIVDLLRLSHQIISNLDVSRGNHVNSIEIGRGGGLKKLAINTIKFFIIIMASDHIASYQCAT